MGTIHAGDSWTEGTFGDESYVQGGRDFVILVQVEHDAALEHDREIMPFLHGRRELKSSSLETIIGRDHGLVTVHKRLAGCAQALIVDRRPYRNEILGSLRESFGPIPRAGLDLFAGQVERWTDEYVLQDAIPQRLLWGMTGGWAELASPLPMPRDPFQLNLLTARRNGAFCEALDPVLRHACQQFFADSRYYTAGRIEAMLTQRGLNRSRIFDDGHPWTLANLEGERQQLHALTQDFDMDMFASAVGTVREQASWRTPGLRLADLLASRVRRAYQQPNGLQRLADVPGFMVLNGRRVHDGQSLAA